MTLALVIKPRAQADVDEQIDYLDADAATRFTDELDHIFGRLLDFPHFGQVWNTRKPDQVAGVRYTVMHGFPVSIFYRPTDTTIDVLRVLHQARDIAPLLAEE